MIAGSSSVDDGRGDVEGGPGHADNDDDNDTPPFPCFPPLNSTPRAKSTRIPRPISRETAPDAWDDVDCVAG